MVCVEASEEEGDEVLGDGGVASKGVDDGGSGVGEVDIFHEPRVGTKEIDGACIQSGRHDESIEDVIGNGEVESGKASFFEVVLDMFEGGGVAVT